MYGRGIPEGEENSLFQYSIASINLDEQTAIIDYDSKCIEEGGSQFTNYPDATGQDESINDCNLLIFKEDHELFLKLLGH